MKKFLILCLSILVSSCIPIKIAPKFKNEEYRIVRAKKFKRKLPRETSFIFKDPKDAEEFYNFLNTKFQLNHQNVGLNTPFQLEGKTFYLSYNETEKEDESVKLPMVLIDLKRKSNGNSALFEGAYTKRLGHWYIILTVYDENVENCLLDNHPMKQKMTEYLKQLKQEYLTTHNYEQLLFTKKS